MQLTHKLLAPVLILTVTTLALLGLALWFADGVEAQRDRVDAADDLIRQVGEVRSLSRALQRDTLNLIFDPEPDERKSIAASVERRSRDMVSRLSALTASASGAETARLSQIATLQSAVLRTLGEVNQIALSGDAAKAHAMFRQTLRQREREASRATDAFMEEMVKSATTMKTAAVDSQDRAAWLLSALGLTSIAVSAAIGLAIVIFGVTRPLRSTTAALTALSKGDFEIETPQRSGNDEIGALISALTVFRDNAIALRRLEKEQAAAEALAQQATQAQRAEIGASFEATLMRACREVDESVELILRASRDMAMREGEGSAGAIQVADDTDAANVRLSMVGSAIEELTASIGEITQQATRSSVTAQSGVEDVAQAAEQIKRLEVASREIAQVVRLINEIAAQTSLLALNATIEAARAGDAGKGFAVVANEVKQLSNQTTAATEGIARQVAAIQSEANQTAAAVDRIRSSIGAIADNATSIASAVEEQRATTDEINRTLSDLTRTMAGTSKGVVALGAKAIHSCAGAIEVLWTTEALEKTAAGLSNDATEFLRKISA